ncbi:hypothetical protein [Sphingomonas sp.]|uniref:hypothetical protein n=1 Tax=Sphingomonas sp. TaxID=28214 RepID=UPI00286A566D|nr:hypothetical protein [Sphingomonas sp.]
MSGYRQSGYDPNAYERMGRPTRPFNWVQWTGVAFGLAGLAIDAAYFAGRFGWMQPLFKSPTSVFMPFLLAIVLINSRREPLVDPAPELAAARGRWLLIVTIFCVVVLGGATVITLFA